MGGVKEALATERDAHGHAVSKYVAEVELRNQLQEELKEERLVRERNTSRRERAEQKQKALEVCGLDWNWIVCSHSCSRWLFRTVNSTKLLTS